MVTLITLVPQRTPAKVDTVLPGILQNVVVHFYLFYVHSDYFYHFVVSVPASHYEMYIPTSLWYTTVPLYLYSIILCSNSFSMIHTHTELETRIELYCNNFVAIIIMIILLKLP